MSVDPKKFGITPSLVETVKEALKGSQHKIDVAEPKGKITGADFKKLRGETSDPVVQSNLDKVNAVASDLKKMASEPIKPMGSKTSTTSLPKATFNLKPPMGEAAKPDFLDLDKDDNKKEPMKHAAKQTKEEVEQVDELSKSTLGSYVKKASGSAATHTGAAAAYGSSSKSPDPKKMAQHQAVATKRSTGIAKAVGKLTKEEVEQVDELSKSTLGSYIKKASGRVADKSRHAGDIENRRDVSPAAKEVLAKQNRKVDNSLKGISRATDRLAKEEVEMTEAESQAAKQIAARKEAMKTHIQKKIANKQMSAMQAKANQRLKSINASNDKCSCGDTNESKMKCEMHGGKDKEAKMGREKIEVNPPLREAEDLPKKVVTKGHEIAKSLIKSKAKVREPYAVGMAQAKKSAGIKD